MNLSKLLIPRTYFRNSSWLSWFEWDGTILTIKAESGSVYQYKRRYPEGATRSYAYQLSQLLASCTSVSGPSAGGFYNRNIKVTSEHSYWKRAETDVNRAANMAHQARVADFMAANMSFCDVKSWEPSPHVLEPSFKKVSVDLPALAKATDVADLQRRMETVEARALRNTKGIKALYDLLYTVTRFASDLSLHLSGTPNSWRDSLKGVITTIRNDRADMRFWRTK